MYNSCSHSRCFGRGRSTDGCIKFFVPFTSSQYRIYVGKHLTHIITIQVQVLNKHTVVYTDAQSNSTLLFNAGDTTSEGIEAVFVSQGILWDFDLPPITSKAE